MSAKNQCNLGNGWTKDGIVMVGDWVSRRWSRRYQADYQGRDQARYEALYTETAVKKMRESGANLVLTHFYLGFGAAAERAEMERTRTFARLCHAHNVRVGVYVQSIGTIFYETFFREVPAARDWVSRNQDGQIPTYGEAYFRYVPCLNCDAYLTYLEDQVLTFAVREVEADLIHFDNFMWWPEPEACRCERCVRRFRAFLEERYPDPERRFAQVGLEHFDQVLPPRFHPLSPPWQGYVARDPLSQAWVDFKCRTLGAVYRRLAVFLKK